MKRNTLLFLSAIFILFSAHPATASVKHRFALNGDIFLVSTSSTGVPTTGGNLTWMSSFSPDGHYAFFWSTDTSLTPDGAGLVQTYHLYRKDLVTGDIRLLAKELDNKNQGWTAFPASSSADNRFITFGSFLTLLPGVNPEGLSLIYVHDINTGITRHITETTDGAMPDSHNFAPGISADGRYVFFESAASNLLVANPGNHYQVFMRDLQTGVMKIASSAADGTPGNGDSGSGMANGSGYAHISQDGRFLAFVSNATNLIPAQVPKEPVFNFYRKDMTTGNVEIVGKIANAVNCSDEFQNLAMSPDGRYIVHTCYPSMNVFFSDMNSGTTIALTDGSGQKLEMFLNSVALVDNARKVYFSDGTNNIYLKDLVSGELQPLLRNLDGSTMDIGVFVSFDAAQNGKQVLFDGTGPVPSAEDDLGIWYVKLH